MANADDIRAFIAATEFGPARDDKLGCITIRAGDIHSALGLQNAMPNVCNVLGGAKLQALTNSTLSGREGPRAGANAYFTFELAGGRSGDETRGRADHGLPRQVKAGGRQMLANDCVGFESWESALILVSCVKTKVSFETEAESLYASPWFRAARTIAQRHGRDWRILSAQYGLVHPGQRIASYEKTLNRAAVAERRRWADQVLEKLLPLAGGFDRVVFLAGARYREFLQPGLTGAGIVVEIPMEALRWGEQLSWLQRNQ